MSERIYCQLCKCYGNHVSSECPSYGPSSLAPVSGWAALVDDSINVLTDVAQVLDGWHNDGTAWSEWDEQVRTRVTELLKRLYSLKQPNDRAKPRGEL
jgi:hypothetical protein